MDHRRFITFLVFFFAFTYLYNAVIVPKFFPRPQQPVVVDGDDGKGGEESGKGGIGNGSDTEGEDGGADDANAEASEDNAPVVVNHPSKSVKIGSLDISSGYFLEAELTSAGAAIETVQLSPPKFRDLENRDEQVTVVGNNATDDRTFSTAIKTVDEQLRKDGLTLETVNWELNKSGIDHASFAYVSPDGTLRIEKIYTLNRVEGDEKQIRTAIRENPLAYMINVELTVTNLSDEEQSVAYELQGPVGVILENRAHTRKYRDIKLEFLGEEDDVTMSTSELRDLYQEHVEQAHAEGRNLTELEKRASVRESDSWTGVIRYAGVDVQFFAALITALDERDVETQQQQKWIDRVYPVMIQHNQAEVRESDISFRIASMPQKLDARGGEDSVTHKYGFFVGPKYETLLDPAPLQAERVLDIDTGFFNTITLGLVGILVRLMHFLLDSFYGFGIPYGLCIILLTVLVRSCMFPISRKQALSAAKMKELQPKLNELKLKYGEDKQKLAQAQMELWRKHGVNPLGGCMPMLFQMPIFIGLYQCLNTSVDLRLSEFLWISNLAAPDALFNFPFDAPPWLGPHLSILPLVTVVLFLVQQKLFMPPPADEQAEMTQKMMNMMTLVFGALFWHQPAGLCLYFTCSSLWGICERKLLGNTKISMDDNDEPSVTVKPKNGGDGGGHQSSKDESAEPAKKGFFARLMDAAEEAQRQAESMKEKERKKNKGKGGKKKR